MWAEHSGGYECGDEQPPFRESEGFPQDFDAFGRLLDDVEDVAEIDHGGGRFRGVGTEGGIPAGRLIAEVLQRHNVHPVAATVVEEGVALGEETAFEQVLTGLERS